MVDSDDFVLPGFMPRKTWAKQIGRCDRTVKRWQDRGQIVVRYFGNLPCVDIEATADRRRAENNRRGRGAV
jgi:hypothetical protein